MQTRQMMDKGAEATARTPEQEPILIDVIDGQHRLLAEQQLLPQLEVPVVLVSSSTYTNPEISELARA